MDGDLEAGQPQQAHCAPRLGDGVAAPVAGQEVVVQTLHAQLHLCHAQPAQAAHLLRRDTIGPRLHHQPDVAVRRDLVEPLRFLQRARIRPVQRVQAAAHEPLLVLFRIGRPRPAQDEQLDLVHVVSDLGHRSDAAGGLGVGVELVGGGPHRAGLVGQVTLGHPIGSGTKDTLAGAGEGLGQHRHRGHARDGARGLDLQTAHQFGVRCSPVPRAQLAVSREELGFGENATVWQRMPAHDARQVLPAQFWRGSHLVQDSDEQITVPLQVERPPVRCSPRCLTLSIHVHLPKSSRFTFSRFAFQLPFTPHSTIIFPWTKRPPQDCSR